MNATPGATCGSVRTGSSTSPRALVDAHPRAVAHTEPVAVPGVDPERRVLDERGEGRRAGDLRVGAVERVPGHEAESVCVDR